MEFHWSVKLDWVCLLFVENYCSKMWQLPWWEIVRWRWWWRWQCPVEPVSSPSWQQWRSVLPSQVPSSSVRAGMNNNQSGQSSQSVSQSSASPGQLQTNSLQSGGEKFERKNIFPESKNITWDSCWYKKFWQSNVWNCEELIIVVEWSRSLQLSLSYRTLLTESGSGTCSVRTSGVIQV